MTQIPYAEDINGHQINVGDRILRASSMGYSPMMIESYVRGFTAKSILLTDYPGRKSYGNVTKLGKPHIPIENSNRCVYVVETSAAPPTLYCNWCRQSDHAETSLCRSDRGRDTYGRRGPV